MEISPSVTLTGDLKSSGNARRPNAYGTSAASQVVHNQRAAGHAKELSAAQRRRPGRRSGAERATSSRRRMNRTRRGALRHRPPRKESRFGRLRQMQPLDVDSDRHDRRRRATSVATASRSAEPHPTSSRRNDGRASAQRDSGRIASSTRDRLPSQSLTKRRSARLDAASSCETPSSACSGSTARLVRSTTSPRRASDECGISARRAMFRRPTGIGRHGIRPVQILALAAANRAISTEDLARTLEAQRRSPRRAAKCMGEHPAAVSEHEAGIVPWRRSACGAASSSALRATA